jgi:RimJ/RimL family protein N-acetyltransferase
MGQADVVGSRCVQLPGYRIDWSTPLGDLMAYEPRLDEVVEHVRVLAAAYNDPHNAPLLGHTQFLAESEVLDHYESLLGQQAHPFLLFEGGALAGDGDIRGIADGAGEFAFMIAAPSAQGRGLGTRFATMLHVFAFTHLPIDRLYASIVPANTASRRVFDKLGYTVDDSAAAREYADEGDVTMVIDKAAFRRQQAAAMAEIRIAMR